MDNNTIYLNYHGYVTLSELKEIQGDKLSGKYQYQLSPSNTEFKKAFIALGESESFIKIGNDLDDDLEVMLDAFDFDDTDDETIKANNNLTNSDFDLIARLRSIHERAERGVFEDSDYSTFLEINSILDERKVSPVDRFAGLKMFDPSACRQADIKHGTAPFMRALQVVDLRFVWRWYRGRKSFEQYAGIFEGEVFNLELGKRIASIKLKVEAKDGKRGKLDNDALNLPRDIQRKLIVLRDDAARQWQSEQRRKIDRLHNERMELEEKLKEYRELHAKSKQLTDASVKAYGLVFIAMKLAKGSHSKAIKEYKALTGDDKKRDFIRDKADRILELSGKHGWGVSF